MWVQVIESTKIPVDFRRYVKSVLPPEGGGIGAGQGGCEKAERPENRPFRWVFTHGAYRSGRVESMVSRVDSRCRTVAI